MTRLPTPVHEQDRLARAFERAAGAPLIHGNAVRLLRDAAENYPAWLEAIGRARRLIRFEQYIIRDDAVGRRFMAALAERAAAGVRVELIADWFGCLGAAGPRFWRAVRASGVQLVIANRPRPVQPFAWVRRDHRKAIVVDDEVAFVSGLCLATAWEGDPERGTDPWRDTGIEVRGPAVAAVARTFDAQWRRLRGSPRPAVLADGERWAAGAVAGDVPVRVVASAPRSTELFRLDLLVAAAARERLWLTDAYFVGTAPYVQALRAAARDGVDVRLLVPDAGDIGWLRPISRAGYRPLLEAGVRVFEWNGAMLHAKTAVADRRWGRVGSTNLNLVSLVGNWELDIAIEHEGVADELAAHFETDLENATEIVLGRGLLRRTQARVAAPPSVPPTMVGAPTERLRLGERARASAGRAAVGALRFGRAVGAALLERRVLGAAEARVEGTIAVVALVVAAVAAIWPRALAWPVAAFGAWIGVAAAIRAWVLRRRRSMPDAP
jgi:cardiolipin synthase